MDAIDFYTLKTQEENRARDLFEDDITPYLELVRVTVDRLKHMASDYYGYNFSDDLADILNDILKDYK